MDGENCIVISKVFKAFGKTRIFQNFSLIVKRYSTVSICGQSGCGKTTLLRLIAGLERPDMGEIFINGKIVSTNNWSLEPYKRGIAFVFQQPALWPHMSVKQNIDFGIKKSQDKESYKLVNEIWDNLEIEDLINRYPGEISGGQAKRVSIARALAAKPDILLMDEPLTNLEHNLKLSVLEYIKEFARKYNITLLFVTHQLDEATLIGKEIINMKDGVGEFIL